MVVIKLRVEWHRLLLLCMMIFYSFKFTYRSMIFFYVIYCKFYTGKLNEWKKLFYSTTEIDWSWCDALNSIKTNWHNLFPPGVTSRHKSEGAHTNFRILFWRSRESSTSYGDSFDGESNKLSHAQRKQVSLFFVVINICSQ